MIFKKIDIFLIIPILCFLFLTLPFSGILPHRDGNIDFLKAYDLYEGGFKQLFQNWQSSHPPFKFIFGTILFKIAGVNTYTYTSIGILFGLIGITTLYLLCRNIFNKRVARISSFLLATSPLFLANSIFSTIDYLQTVLILIAIYFFSKRRLLLYGIASSIVVLTKETGIVFPLAIICVELTYIIKNIIIKNRQDIKNKLEYLLFFLPILTYLAWILFLRMNGKNLWNDYVFSEIASKGPILTVIGNLISFKFLNQYTYQHWMQLFILNFNWLYWIAICLGLIILKKENWNEMKRNIIKGDSKIKIKLILIFFFIAYLFSVLTFPTYTIPRYALPIIPIFIVGVSLAINNLIKNLSIFRILFLTLFIIVTPLSLFHSVDPISIKIWNNSEYLFGEKIYALNRTVAGNDGVTYNMQYLLIAKKRSDEITRNLRINSTVYLSKCQELFPDPNNDRRTMSILGLNNSASCLYREGVNW